MSERPTPETDALAEKLIPIAEKITEFNAQSIIKQLLTEILTKTTKLERERDDAREVVRNIVRAGRVGRQWQSYAIEFLEKLEKVK